MSYWTQSGAYQVLQRIANLVVGLGAFYLLVRTFGIEKYGVWVLFLTITTVLELLKDGFIKNGFIKFLAESSKNERVEVQSSAFLLSLIVTLVSTGVLILIGPFLATLWKAEIIQTLIVVYISTSLFRMINSYCDSLQNANFDFIGSFWAVLINKLSFFLVILYYYIYKLDLSLIDLAIWQAVTSFLGMIVAILYTHKYFVYGFSYNFSFFSKMYHFGKYTFATTLNSQVLRNIDSWMLGGLLGPAPVSLYNAALRISNLYDVPSVSLASILFPRAVKNVALVGDSEVKRLYEKSVAYLFGIIFPFVIFLIFFSEEIIFFVAGEEYLGAVPVLQVTVLYGLLVPFLRQFGILLDAVGKVKINFALIAVITVVNIVLNYLFISWIGLMGAAYATFTSFVVGLIFTQLYMRKYYNVGFGKFFEYIYELYVLLYSKLRALKLS